MAHIQVELASAIIVQAQLAVVVDYPLVHASQGCKVGQDGNRNGFRLALRIVSEVKALVISTWLKAQGLLCGGISYGFNTVVALYMLSGMVSLGWSVVCGVDTCWMWLFAVKANC